jgi:chemotaxis protein MotB
MQKTSILLIAAICLLSLGSCVKASLYRSELSAKSAAEAREKTLVMELVERRKESADLILKVSNCNQTVGRQEATITNLNTELTTRTQSLGESSSKLSAEKTTVEKDLISTREQLKAKEAIVDKVKTAQQQRTKTNSELEQALVQAFVSKMETGISVVVENDQIQLTLPDKSLFETTGLQISTDGKALLESLATFLSTRPDLDVDIVAYTDNVLPPKEKTLKDTWDWSLQRATNIVRLLIREFNVNANQLSPIGRGEFYPLTSNETAEGRQKNRRTIVVLRPLLTPIPIAD